MGAAVSYVVSAPRTSELIAWLTCNDVNPRDVPYPSQVFVETLDGVEWVIRYEAYVRSSSGAIKYDADAEAFEYAERAVPMENDPPMWWLKEVAPSPEQAVDEGAVGLPCTADAVGSEETVADGACNQD